MKIDKRKQVWLSYLKKRDPNWMDGDENNGDVNSPDLLNENLMLAVELKLDTTLLIERNNMIKGKLAYIFNGIETRTINLRTREVVSGRKNEQLTHNSENIRCYLINEWLYNKCYFLENKFSDPCRRITVDEVEKILGFPSEVLV